MYNILAACVRYVAFYATLFTVKTIFFAQQKCLIVVYPAQLVDVYNCSFHSASPHLGGVFVILLLNIITFLTSLSILSRQARPFRPRLLSLFCLNSTGAANQAISSQIQASFACSFIRDILLVFLCGFYAVPVPCHTVCLGLIFCTNCLWFFSPWQILKYTAYKNIIIQQKLALTVQIK